jgi:ABC-type branched-subunit amino acid transport system substrate-binding protein
MQGVYGATGFWWTLEEKYPVAKDFVSAFEKKYNQKPHDSAYTAYLATALWADGIERAGTFYPPDVIKALEKGVKRDGPVGQVWFRGEDHQGVINFPIVRGKKPSEMRNKSDLFEVVEVIDGSKVLPPVGHFGCKLGSYV